MEAYTPLINLSNTRHLYLVGCINVKNAKIKPVVIEKHIIRNILMPITIIRVNKDAIIQNITAINTMVVKE